MSQVAQQLMECVLALYDKHLAASGKSVDYKGLAADPGFQLFVDATAELQKLDVSAFAREERMAFWINIYNILVVSHPQSHLSSPPLLFVNHHLLTGETKPLSALCEL